MLVTLLTLVLIVIIDLERPTAGGIQESQATMELLRASRKSLRRKFPLGTKSDNERRSIRRTA